MNREDQINAQQIAGRMVGEHVYCNVGGIVYRLQELAEDGDEALIELCEPTAEDYRQALEDHGAKVEDDGETYVLAEEFWSDVNDGERTKLDAADLDEAIREACERVGIEPEVEVYEWWAVSDWLADKLREKGEHVGDLYGLTVWGRQATGQAIKLDSAIQEIALDTPRYADAAEG